PPFRAGLRLDRRGDLRGGGREVGGAAAEGAAARERRVGVGVGVGSVGSYSYSYSPYVGASTSRPMSEEPHARSSPYRHRERRRRDQPGGISGVARGPRDGASLLAPGVPPLSHGPPGARRPADAIRWRTGTRRGHAAGRAAGGRE